MAITLFKPTLRRKDMDNALSCMVSDRVTEGPYHDELVSETNRFLGTAGGVALCSYVSSIVLACEIAGLVPGDSVLISPLAPIVYLAAFKRLGLAPVFCDVDQNTGLLSHEEVDKAITKNPKVIVLHHTLGFVPDMDHFQSLGLPLIEDISQALGALWKEAPVGSFGIATLSSLSEENIITGGGGGLLLVKKKQDLQNLRHIIDSSMEYVKLFNLNAAVAYSQIRELPHFIASRQEIAGVFSDALHRTRHTVLVQKEGGVNIPFSFPVIVETSVKDARSFAKKKGMDTQMAFNESIITTDDAIYNEFPNAKSLLLRCVLFPLYPALGRKNVETIAKVLQALP
ncbi:MAG: DegT/DnrJ/EryC1/StrS aminotransferase family protein [Spirochaetaceae bacterium]|nr:MAG: DegT/DnrJ/EryC1/StrS aminotransferase family protein [Spirochaetaceae bacterium]